MRKDSQAILFLMFKLVSSLFGCVSWMSCLSPDFHFLNCKKKKKLSMLSRDNVHACHMVGRCLLCGSVGIIGTLTTHCSKGSSPLLACLVLMLPRCCAGNQNWMPEYHLATDHLGSLRKYAALIVLPKFCRSHSIHSLCVLVGSFLEFSLVKG